MAERAPLQITGIFKAVGDMEEIGARPEDRVVVRPWDPSRACSLVRRLSPTDVRYVLDGRAELLFTKPLTSDPAAALRRIREDMRYLLPPGGHLTLLH